MIKAIFLMIFLSPSTLLESPLNYLVIWNVGQGSWSTLLKGHECWHFDAGGETYPSPVEKLCRQKQNKIFISHDDWDHISFISRLLSWPELCLYKFPLKIKSARNQKIFNRLKVCPTMNDVTEVEWPRKGKTANDLSRVFYLPYAQTLFPGDSTSGEEKRWAPKTKNLTIKWWLLGHHGSKTSSSEILIKNIGHPLAAISSSRYKRYRHPHHLVQARLRQNGISLLRTEDWGHLWIQI